MSVVDISAIDSSLDSFAVGTQLGFGDLAVIEWHPTTILTRFPKPVHMLSTSRVNGGQHDDMTAAMNFRICKPGECPTSEVCLDDLDAYIADHAKSFKCDPDLTASMLTSTDMENAGTAYRSHGDVCVAGVVTAGVDTNAARAGDPATHFESVSGWKSIDEMPVGTINMLLLFSHPLSVGAIVKASIMATEAKTATLQSLRVPSKYSDGLATGTRTDQFVIAAPKDGPLTLTEAQAHIVVGQMIAETVSESLRLALERHGGPVSL